MKLNSIQSLMLVVTGASAFIQPYSFSSYRIENELFGISKTKLSNSRGNTEEAVKAALAASEKYGVTSKEAQILWDTVEEISASDNSAAYTGGISEDECLLADGKDAECEKYYSKLAELSEVLDENKFRMDNVKNLVTELQNIKVSAPKVEPAPIDTEAMQEALLAAKKATEDFGITSSQAKLAWETVEEIAASNNSEAYKASLDDECLIETMQACEAIEELSRAVNLLSSDSRYQG